MIKLFCWMIRSCQLGHLKGQKFAKEDIAAKEKTGGR